MRRIAATLLAGLIIAGCQTVPAPTISSNPQLQPIWESRQQRLDRIDHFVLSGRIASNSLGGGSADLSWNQDGERLLVSLSGMLGVGALRIEGTPDDLIITTREGRYEAEAAQQALAEKLGSPLPIADLRYWVVGVPRPGVPGTIGLDPEGRLGHLEQDRWQLDFLEYRATDDPSLSLPRKIWFSCNGNRWKLVIDQWSIMR